MTAGQVLGQRRANRCLVTAAGDVVRGSYTPISDSHTGSIGLGLLVYSYYTLEQEGSIQVPMNRAYSYGRW